jgi:hypothetical protein
MREQGGCVTSVLIQERLVMGLLYVVSSVMMVQHSEWLGAYYESTKPLDKESVDTTEQARSLLE